VPRKESATKSAALHLTALLIGLFVAAPFVLMVLISLREPSTSLPQFSELIPEQAHWENYSQVLFMPEIPVLRFLFNSLLVTSVIVICQLFICSLAAYAFARMVFRGRNQLFLLVLMTMMFAGTVTQLPVFLMMRSVNWLDTYWALIIPGISSSFNIFLLRQFFLQIPKSMDEAARLDGASDWRICWSVVVPTSKAALATAGAFTFFAVWTDFFWPLLAVSSIRMRTLEVGLSIFKNSYGGTNWPLQMTAAVIVLLPLVIVFLAAQKFFVRGVTMGSVK
jgi:multiple sugar transport system permease protein